MTTYEFKVTYNTKADFGERWSVDHSAEGSADYIAKQNQLDDAMWDSLNLPESEEQGDDEYDEED